MIRQLIIYVLCVCLCGPAFALTEFQKNNPDGKKYEFVRSYISALSYFSNIDQRWKKAALKKVYAGKDVDIMRAYVAILIKDDADLRIAKNFLTKYLNGPNLLMHKAADTFISACLTEIAINARAKEVWDQWYAVKSNNRATFANERAFVKAQEELAYKRRDAEQFVIESSLLTTKVIKSAQNVNEKGHLLAITAKERERLLDHLDEFGKDTMDWGLKPNQTTLQASIAVLREVLEDSVWTTLDSK